MSDLFALAYPWLKWVHILALISWMAGILYLPRLFVHHVESAPEDARAVFEMMEEKLLRIIMTPAMIVTWITGLLLIVAVVDLSGEYWIYVKLLLVLAMSAFHGACAKWRRELASGTNTRSGRYFRIANEVPTLLLIAIAFLVVFKPF